MVSQQAPHLAGASLGAGAPTSHPPLQGAVPWLTVAELTCVCPKTAFAAGLGTTSADTVNAAALSISAGTSSLSLCLPCGQTKPAHGLQGTLTTLAQAWADFGPETQHGWGSSSVSTQAAAPWSCCAAGAAAASLSRQPVSCTWLLLAATALAWTVPSTTFQHHTPQ